MFRSIKIRDFRQFQDRELFLGKYATVLAGRNSTGKSTILGLLANCAEIKKSVAGTYTNGRFRAEFSEIIKGSKQFDKTDSGIFQIIVDEPDGTTITCEFRTTWQKYDSDDKTAERFRVIPKWKKPLDQTTTEAKLERPVIYLGLSRLFPVGEAQKVGVKQPKLKFDNPQHESWFNENYLKILSINETLKAVTNYSIGETDKKIGVGITTDNYDYLTNSSGQDNLGQILLSILSFKRIREKLDNEWKGGLLLIDEIDATLHPVAQNRLLELLVKEAKATGFQVVFTTHSLSLLRYAGIKIEHNTKAPNQNIEVYYFTNANRRLDLVRNPPYYAMENDLMIQSAVQNHPVVKVYTEDAEARWLLGKIIGTYESYVELLKVKVGCQSLMTMYMSDMQYFTQTLIVLDGDVSNKTLSTVPKALREKFGNIMLLPGKKRPEEVLYNYILSLKPEHEFWAEAAPYSLTWQFFKDNGPDSPSYKRLGNNKTKERDKYKAWFLDHVQLFNQTHLGEYWVRDNKDEVERFLANFKSAYNSVANRMFAPLIKD
jgi:predicted ATPase